MDHLTKVFEWIFWICVLLTFFTRRKQPAVIEEESPLIINREGIRPQLPKGWSETIDGNSVIWKMKPSLNVALGCFLVGVFIAGILIAIALGNQLPAPQSYIIVDEIFPPWHHPFDVGSWVKVFLNLVPLLCLALCLWFIGGEKSFRISTNRLERTYRWFRWSRTKVFTNATLLLKAIAENREAPRAYVWKWFIEIQLGPNQKLLFLSRSLVNDAGNEYADFEGYLKMRVPERIISELSRLTGWPAKTIFRFEAQPFPSDSTGS